MTKTVCTDGSLNQILTEGGCDIDQLVITTSIMDQ